MSRLCRLVSIFLGLLLLCFNQVNAQRIRGITPSPRMFSDINLRKITKANLKQILRNHELWQKTSGKQGEPGPCGIPAFHVL